MDEPLPVVNSKSQGVDEPDDDMDEAEDQFVFMFVAISLSLIKQL